MKAFTMILEVMDEIYVFLAEFLQDAKTICFGEPVRSPTSPQREPPSRNSSVQCMDMWDFFHMDFIPGDEGYEYIVDVEQGIRAGGRSSDADSNESAYPRPSILTDFEVQDSLIGYQITSRSTVRRMSQPISPKTLPSCWQGR